MSEPQNKLKGGFTLPGEAGYEKLTLELAEKWGADVIRDSDGTVLSDEILNAGYGIYSTICIIRDHNEWASRNPDKLQQTFLMTHPRTATEDYLTVHLLEDFFDQQFRVNATAPSLKLWQVYDRTTGSEVNPRFWTYDSESGNVTIQRVIPWHQYTVNFLAYRIWEEISMYNHTTNHWDKEHLMQIDPIYPETQDYLLGWMKDWCESHPTTTVVRFTSMFYNFVWIWGSDERNRNLYSDWASYDFTVSPRMLDLYEQARGYRLTSEDFINGGKLHVTHMPPTARQLDYMDFVASFVSSFGRKLVDLVHSYGKKAYVFYDDSWIGVEPYGKYFKNFDFDGLIKCVFSGYEARLNAAVDVPTHELRLHPYLFPVGLGGLPTFMEGGDPTRDAKIYWNSVRRALLRARIDRIGLGGYLHLTEGFPDFQDYIAKIADEFRTIHTFHENGAPYKLPCRVAVLHSWGSLRSWSLSGHFHETYMHDLIHVNEALSGLPVDVDFISFEDILAGKARNYQVIINAGAAGTAWSGGKAWAKPELVEILTKWVHDGGTFLGVNEPSAVPGDQPFFALGHVLGVEEDSMAKVCHGKWAFETETIHGLLPEGSHVGLRSRVHLTDGKAKVLAEEAGAPVLTVNPFGSGMGIYLSSFETTVANNRLLLNLLLYGCRMDLNQRYLTDNANTECAYYPAARELVVINNTDRPQDVTVRTESGEEVFRQVEGYDTVMRKI